MATGEIVSRRAKTDSAGRVCPAWLVGSFDNFIRLWVHNPGKLFGLHVRRGMTVLDVGCGAGWATEGLAELVGEKGTVIAADLQDEMLAMVRRRMERKGLAHRVVLHRCEADRVGMTGKVDFAVAFWMAHETPDVSRLLAELWGTLSTGGRLYLVEPIGHVRMEAFEREVRAAWAVGFVEKDRPGVFLSRAVVLEKAAGRGETRHHVAD